MILTDLQLQIRDAARAFAQKEIAPHAAEWDRTCTVPIHALRAMGPLGFMGMCVAPQWGGAGPTWSPTRSRWRRSRPGTAVCAT